MRTAAILLLIFLALYFLSRVRLGVSAAFDEAGMKLALRLGPFRISLLPTAPQKKKISKKKSEKERKGSGGVQWSRALLRDLIPELLDALGRMKRKLCVHHLHLRLIMGNEDPAACATAYGAANAAAGMIWPLLEQNLNIKDGHVHIGFDFGLTRPQIDFFLEATFTLGQLLSMGLRTGTRILCIFARAEAARSGNIKTMKRKEAV